MNQKVLVTGAGGFIGSHLVEELVRLGHEVRAFVRYNARNDWGWLQTLPCIKDIEVYSGDIRDYDSVKHAVKGTAAIFHLAALIGIPYSYSSPLAYIKTNVEGTYNILQSAREEGVGCVVHTSTSEVYGTARYVPIDEAHPLQAQSPYAATKIAADQLALSYYRSFGLPVAVIRPFNTYGPRQSARAVIPAIITQLAGGWRRIHLGALHPTRDFNFVKDTVRGFMAASKSKKAIGEVINIGSNYEISIEETAYLIAEAMGVELDIEVDQERLRPVQSEVERLWADNSKARSVLEWEPLYAGRHGFKKGLLETVNWFTHLANLNGYKSQIYNV